MQAEFRPPRRRTRVQEEYDAPLPVSRSPEDRSNFRAELINQHVLVCDPDHIQKIYSQGYFGKGVLSRARPDHSLSEQWEQHEGLFLPVVSQSRYEELLRWAGAALSAQGLEEEAVRQTLLRVSQPVNTEDVKKEVGGGEDEDEGSTVLEDRVCPLTERPRSEVKLEAKRSCSSDSPDMDPHPTSDLDPHPTSDLDPHPTSDLDPHPTSDLDPHPTSDLDPHPTSGLEHETSSDLESDSSYDSDLRSDPQPLVPGPGFVLVVSDSEDGGRFKEVRHSPFSFTEYLQLSLEEAFFLVYALGCLSVYQNQEPLSVMELWATFRFLRPDFISSYAAYHHFRSRGWIPKGGSGAKYGADLMLYRKGPPFYHASYSVVIERVDDAFRGSALRPFSWRSLAALSRITANVSKELMLCYIIHPADQSKAELESPVCLNRLQVQELIVSRWVSSRERAEQDDI